LCNHIFLEFVNLAKVQIYIITSCIKVLLDIKDSKGAFVMELLRNLKFVKAKPLTPYAAEVLEGIKEAVGEMKQVKAGKLKGVPAKDLLNDL